MHYLYGDREGWTAAGCCLNKSWADDHMHDNWCSVCCKFHFWLGCEKLQSCGACVLGGCKVNLMGYGTDKKGQRVMMCPQCHKIEARRTYPAA